MTKCDLAHSCGHPGRNRVGHGHIPQKMSLQNPVSPTTRRKEDEPMMHSDLRQRDRYRFVTDRDVGKWPRKGSLGGGAEKFSRHATENHRRVGTRRVAATYAVRPGQREGVSR